MSGINWQVVGGTFMQALGADIAGDNAGGAAATSENASESENKTAQAKLEETKGNAGLDIKALYPLVGLGFVAFVLYLVWGK